MKSQTMLVVLGIAAATAASAQVQKTIYDVEQSFKENELSAAARLKGKTLSFHTFVIAVKNQGGKPMITAGNSYGGGNDIYLNAYLNAASKATAMKLKPGDEIKLTASFANRVVNSKDSLVISGYIPSGYSYSSGSINGGTVTTSWPVYTFNGASVSLVQSAVARAKAQADAEAAAAKKQGAIDAAWKEACGHLDAGLLKKAIDLGVPGNYVDSALEEINRMDPSLAIYPQAKDFYLALIKCGKANIGNAIARSIGMDPTWGGMTSERPQLFKLLVENDFVNLNFKFANGDTFLHYFVKERNYGLRPEIAPKNLRMMFSGSEVEFIEILANAKGNQGLADIKDQYAMSPRDYVKAERSFLSDRDGYAKIKKLIEGMPK